MILQDHSRKNRKKNRAVDLGQLGEVLLPLCFSFPVTQSILLVTLLSPNVWVFSKPSSSPRHRLVGLQLSSDTVCLEMASIPQVRPSATKLPPHFRCQSLVVGPQVTHNLCLTWLQIRSSHNTPLSLILLQWHTEQQFIYQFIKGYDLESTNEQPHKGKCKVGSGEYPGALSSALWSQGASPCWYVDVFSHLEDLQTPYHWDFMEASSLGDE